MRHIPPYPLRTPRQYGNASEAEWVDFLTKALEPIVGCLVKGGSVVLNVSNDIFRSKSPARSTYLERMVLALEDRLGLYLMDRWIWSNPAKPPGPTYWACVKKQQLCAGWEPIYWFCNDPTNNLADNQRVLIPHSDTHRQLLASGGEKRTAEYGDGAYKLRPGSFAKKTAGKIPKNVITRGNRCSDSLAVHQLAKQLGMPAHPAMFPTDIPGFAIDLLTQEGDLVVDPFAGANKTGLAAERRGRRWIASEKVIQYIRLQSELFSSETGFQLHAQ